MKFVIFDIDNCLADDSRRQKHIPRHASPMPYPPSAWDAYHKGAAHDEVMNAHVVNGYISAAEDVLIVFITARPDAYRAKTDWWLREKFPALTKGNYALLMRPATNTKRSPELKVELFEHLSMIELGNGEDGWSEVLAAYDDREDVLMAYAERGVQAVFTLDKNGPMRVTNTPRPQLTLESYTKDSPDGGHTDFLHGPETDVRMAHKQVVFEGRIGTQEEPAKTVPDALELMAKTFRERNAVYGSNWEMVAPVMKAMFPEGLPDESIVFTHQWHLFELIIVKLTRFTVSGLTHQDSIHDAAVYAAMIDNILENSNDK